MQAKLQNLVATHELFDLSDKTTIMILKKVDERLLIKHSTCEVMGETVDDDCASELFTDGHEEYKAKRLKELFYLLEGGCLDE